MVAHGRVELLAHPLSQKYLQMKWNAYGKYFHVTNLLIYTVFLSFVTVYASLLMQNVEYKADTIPEKMNPATDNLTGSTVCIGISFNFIFPLFVFLNYLLQSQFLRSTNHQHHEMSSGHRFVFNPIRVCTLMFVTSIAIIIYIVLSTLREFLQIYQQKWQYLFEPNNFISWMLYISAAIMVSPVFNGGWISDLHFSATSLTVFLSWFNLLLFLQRFDQVRL